MLYVCSLAPALSLLLQVLQPPHGVVFVAAKSFYFGVGGGTASFMQLVKEDGILECNQVCVWLLCSAA